MKYTFVMRCDGHSNPEDSYTALVEADSRHEAYQKAAVELTTDFDEDGKSTGNIYILIVFAGHPTIDGFGFQTGLYE
jgi:hypothetical protein